MLDPKIAAAVEGATVRLRDHSKDGTPLDGLGVLVPRGFLLTAARCISLAEMGSDVMDPPRPVLCETRDGRNFLIDPVAVEHFTDIAALTSRDSQHFWSDAEAFKAFAAGASHVPLRLAPIPAATRLDVALYTHQGTWVGCAITIFQEHQCMLWIEASQAVERETAGGPIVDMEGRLVAIASAFCGLGAGCNGMHPFPAMALPVWVVQQIETAMRKEDVGT